MDYEGTKRNVGPPGHPYGAAHVAILERDGGMSSMCRGRASIFRDDYLGIRENRVTHTHTHTHSLIGAHRALVYSFLRRYARGGHSFSEGGPPFSVSARLPLCLLSGQSAPPPCASDGSSRSAASLLLCRRGGRRGCAPTHDFDGKKLTIKNMTIWKN